MGILYKLTFPNNKSYIGLTAQKLKIRIGQHKATARQGNGGPLQKAIRKYGYDSFSVKQLLQINNYEKLKEAEKRAIKRHKTKVPFGYNLTDGGDGVLGMKKTKKDRAELSKAQKLSFQNPARKKKHLEAVRTEEYRRKQSENTRRRMTDPSYIEYLSQKMKEKWQDEEYRELVLSKPRGPKPINDGLTRDKRYRLRHYEEYTKRKREAAKTPEEKERRKLYMREWRKKHPNYHYRYTKCKKD